MKVLWGILIFALALSCWLAPLSAQEAEPGQAAAEKPAAEKAPDKTETTPAAEQQPTADEQAAKEPAAGQGEKAAEPTAVCTVKSAEGTVEWRPTQDAAWQPLKAGDKLPLGADICTGFRAKCTLEFAEQSSAVEVEPLTIIRLGEFEKEGNKVRTRLYVKQGGAKTIVEKSRFESDFAIVTPEVTLAVRGTTLWFKQFGDKGPLVGLNTGGMNVSDNKNNRKRNMRPGDQLKQGLAPAFQNMVFGSKIPVFDTHGGLTKHEQFSVMFNRQQTFFGTANQNAPNGSGRRGNLRLYRLIQLIQQFRASQEDRIIHEWEVD